MSDAWATIKHAAIRNAAVRVISDKASNESLISAAMSELQVAPMTPDQAVEAIRDGDNGVVKLLAIRRALAEIFGDEQR